MARVRPLVAEKALPEQDLDAATANLRIAQNISKAREANLNQLRLLQKTSIQQAEAAIQAAKAALQLTELNQSAHGRSHWRNTDSDWRTGFGEFAGAVDED